MMEKFKRVSNLPFIVTERKGLFFSKNYNKAVLGPLARYYIVKIEFNML